MRALGQVGLAAALAAVLCAQNAQQPAPFRADSTDVLVDVVVRDKKGRLVRGLTAGEVVVKEDGVEQEITSFREVTAAPGGERPRDASPATTAPGARQERVQVSKDIRLVSLVFDRLGPEGRRLSRQAAQEFLKRDLGTNVYFAIFRIDRGFQVVQQYTNDRERLRRAIEAATGGERSDFNNDLAALQRGADNSKGNAGAAAAVSGGPGAAPVDGGSLSDEQAGRMAKEMLDFSEMIGREDLGRMSVFSLWAIVKEMKKLPGRKTALYFAEGVQMPNGLLEQFKSLISEANLANVSVYAIDARGLMTTSDMGNATARLSEAAQWSRYARSTQTESAEGNKQEFRTFDRATDSLRANQQNVMMELAELTGGFLIANTNDFRPGLQKLSEELNTYYEISYHPKNQLYDGRFRGIQVSVKRADAQIQARNGYFALPHMEGQTVFTYEVPLLRTLGRAPLPRDVEFRSAVVQFRPQFGMKQAMMVFDLPLKDVKFTRDEKAGKYRTHITVLALVKDAEGRVVGKLSRDVPLNEPLDRLSGFQAGRLIVTRPVFLPPGRYTVESVAADQEGDRVAAKKSVLVVSAQAERGVGLSDITLVRRMDKPAEPRDPQDPFQIATGRIVPTLSDTVPGGAGKMLSLYFLVYPDGAAGAEAPKLVLDLVKDGQVVARSVPALPAADATGAVPYLANLPLDEVKPGQYQFRATLLQGQANAQKSMYLNVE